MFEIIRVYCAECGTDLTDRTGFGDAYSCPKCDAWTRHVIIKNVPMLTTADTANGC